jgi:hypothetical protein
MNPNQMNMAKAMVTMHALQEEAVRSRASRASRRRPSKARTDRSRDKDRHFFGFLGLALPGRR